MIKVLVITISDTRNIENDISGKTIINILTEQGYNITNHLLIHDEISEIEEKLINYSDMEDVDIIITNGGTGCSYRDVTPEATEHIIEKKVPGLSEYMRYEGSKITKKAYLSRGIVGIRNNTLIINLPGSPKGAQESLEAIIDLIPHTIAMINGEGH